MLRAEVDHRLGRVLWIASGDVSGPEYVAWTMDLLTAQPVLGGYDYIYDLLLYEGRVGHDDIAGLAPRYAALVGEADRGAVTVLVTLDEGFRFWAELLAVQFPHRQWHVLPSLAAADAVLREAAAARPPRPSQGG